MQHDDHSSFITKISSLPRHVYLAREDAPSSSGVASGSLANASIYDSRLVITAPGEYDPARPEIVDSTSVCRSTEDDRIDLHPSPASLHEEVYGVLPSDTRSSVGDRHVVDARAPSSTGVAERLPEKSVEISSTVDRPSDRSTADRPRPASDSAAPAPDRIAKVSSSEGARESRKRSLESFEYSHRSKPVSVTSPSASQSSSTRPSAGVDSFSPRLRLRSYNPLEYPPLDSRHVVHVDTVYSQILSTVANYRRDFVSYYSSHSSWSDLLKVEREHRRELYRVLGKLDTRSINGKRSDDRGDRSDRVDRERCADRPDDKADDREKQAKSSEKSDDRSKSSKSSDKAGPKCSKRSK